MDCKREERGAKKEKIPNILAQSPIPTHSNQAKSSTQATSCGAL